MTRNVCIHSILTDMISRGICEIGKNMIYLQYMQLSSCDKKQFMYRIKRDKLKLNLVPRVSEYISSVCFWT